MDVENAKKLYPSTHQLGVEGWLQFFDTAAGAHAMGRIIGDIYSEIVSQEEKEKGIHRMGRRPRPAQASWDTVHAAVFPAHYTNERFAVAFQDLLSQRSMSLRSFASRVPVHLSTLSRLLNEVLEPDLTMLAVIAGGCRVEPGYFMEYRAKFLAEVLQRSLIRSPHKSITLLQGLQRDRDKAHT